MSSPQLPLALRFPPDQRFGQFVADDATIVELLAAIARGQREDWVLLSGPSGSGKTHLLLAACAEAEAHDLTAAYLPLRERRGDAAALLAGAERSRIVAIDDVDALTGSRADEIALFDFHNRARAADCSVLYAAAAPAAALDTQLPDLRSRLAQCTQLRLAALDETGRRTVLRRRGERRGLQLDDSVLDYLFQRVGRDLAGLTALLDRIDRASLAAQRRVTVPFVRTLLSE